MDLVCTRCGFSEKSNRRSEDKMDEDATHKGWFTGLPNGMKWCPTCVTSQWAPRTVHS